MCVATLRRSVAQLHIGLEPQTYIASFLEMKGSLSTKATPDHYFLLRLLPLLTTPRSSFTSDSFALGKLTIASLPFPLPLPRVFPPPLGVFRVLGNATETVARLSSAGAVRLGLREVDVEFGMADPTAPALG